MARSTTPIWPVLALIPVVVIGVGVVALRPVSQEPPAVVDESGSEDDLGFDPALLDFGPGLPDASIDPSEPETGLSGPGAVAPSIQDAPGPAPSEATQLP